MKLAGVGVINGKVTSVLKSVSLANFWGRGGRGGGNVGCSVTG